MFLVKYIYNNIKNANIDHILFELNCKYYSYVFLQKNTNSSSKFGLAIELTKQLRNLLLIYQQNIIYD